MYRILSGIFTLLIPVVMLATTWVAWAAPEADHADDETTLNVKLGYDRTVGKYGQSATSTTSTNSVAITYDTDAASFDVLFPYLSQSGPGRLIAIAGRRPIVVLGSDQKASGLGDITAGMTRYALNEEDHGVDLDFGATIKFHSASAAKGLGSGKTDLALQSNLAHSFGLFSTALTVGYSIVGKPPNQHYRNAFYSSLDGSFKISKAVSVGLTYSGGASIIQGLPGSRDVTAYINFKPTRKIKFDIYYLTGRSTQSPDNGAGITVAYDF